MRLSTMSSATKAGDIDRSAAAILSARRSFSDELRSDESTTSQRGVMASCRDEAAARRSRRNDAAASGAVSFSAEGMIGPPLIPAVQPALLGRHEPHHFTQVLLIQVHGSIEPNFDDVP